MTHHSGQGCDPEFDVEKEEYEHNLVRRCPQDEQVRNGVQEPLRVDRDVVGDFAGGVLGSSLARKLHRFSEDGGDECVPDVDGEDIQLWSKFKLLLTFDTSSVQ